MATWDDITAAVGLALGGDRDEGRSALRQSWNQTAESDHAQRCVIAHYLAAYLGYADQAHLSREFKTVTGSTPASFRATARREDPDTRS
ncbi:MAG: helix-turn-helix transcriptional regulator [Actinomycetales bacterium]|nr:helix-turn-helix transcriptional regulator [Candidatus Lutibacillus vidarii]